MNRNIKHGLTVIYCFIGLLFLTSIGLYLCRNQLLHYIADKKIQKIESEYNLSIHYDKLQFNGIREIELNKFSVVPLQRDTLLNLNLMKLKLNVFPLLFGNVEINDMALDKLALTFIKRDSISNYDFLFKKKNSDSTQVKKRSYSDRVNSLLNLFYNYLPENGTLNNILVSYQKDNHILSCTLPTFRIKDDRFSNEITIKEDNNTPQLWKAAGELNHSSQTMEVALSALSPYNKITVPILDRRFKAHVTFNSLVYRMSKTKHFGLVQLSGKAMIGGLEIFHKALSPEVIYLNKGLLAYNINVGSNYIELDSTSNVQFNELQFNPYIKAEKNDKKWHFTLSVDKPWFPSEQLFSSLPQGLFGNLKGIQTNGQLSYHFLLDIDFAHLNALKFHSSLNQRNFHILNYGATNLGKMNGEFMYTAYDNGRPVRTFPIGPSWEHYTPLDSISPLLKMAVLQSEDGSFYSHRGFRQETLRNALIYDLKVKRFARGGSTITMQLVKNVFLNRSKNIARKLEEALIVWLIENKNITSKNRMFEIYLNIAEWAPMTYGIHEASEYYFNKRPSQLSLEESIFLASIIPKPKHFTSSFTTDSIGNIKLKSYMSGYYRLIARLLARRGLIDRTKADSIKANVELNGRAHERFAKKDSAAIINEEEKKVLELEKEK